MNVTYDAEVDSAYIQLIPVRAGDAARTYACDPEEVGGQIQLDFDDSGRLIGIEVLDASHLLPKVLLTANPASKRSA